MGLAMVIGLYSTRLILAALGAVDYGIFNLVGGVIGMLTFLNASMTVSSQRYFSVTLGANDIKKSKQLYQLSTYLHLIIGIIIVIALEIFGLYIFDGFLNIPADRINTAKLVYQFMIISTFFTINAVPFDAVINAHENMLFDSVLGIIETLLKLAIAFLITFYGEDKLLLYVILYTSLTVLVRIVKSFYCVRNYEECKIDFRSKVDKPLLREMLSFASFNLVGSLAGIGRNQGLSLILNIFFGTVINAAYGIANQVAGQLSSFSSMMLKAVNPQLMKSEGANDRNRMLKIAMISSKLSFFLLGIFAIPFIFEMNSILNLWLKNVPENSVIFCQLVLIANLTNLLTIGMASALQATGKIKQYQTVVGLVLLLNLPLAYVLLYYGLPAYFAIASYIIIEFIACLLRLGFIKKIAGLSIKEYLNRVIFCLVGPVFLGILASYIITNSVEINYRFLLTVPLCSFVMIVSMIWLGLYKEEKEIVNKLSMTIKSKIGFK
ncbi:hypothetical protein HCO57_02160 [Croceivirga sp. JEA036]|nr:hypothetical protein [Croceivirga sp. JEA036]